jgi:hypothetical protein
MQRDVKDIDYQTEIIIVLLIMEASISVRDIGLR